MSLKSFFCAHENNQIAVFCCWWICTLQTLQPRFYREWKKTRQVRIELEIDDDEVTATYYQGTVAIKKDPICIQFDRYPKGSQQPLTEILGPYKDQNPCIWLRLPPRRFFYNVITLPQAAEENLREVVTYEINRFTPCETHQIYFDYTVVKRHHSTLSLLIVVVLRDVVDKRVKRAASWGLEIDNVVVPQRKRQDLPEVEDFAPNLRVDNLRKEGFQPTNLVTKLLLVVNTLLFVAVLVYPLGYQGMVIASLEERVSKVEKQVKIVKGLEAEMRELTDNANEIIRMKQARPMFLDVIEEFTRVLPYDRLARHGGARNSYLKRMKIHGDKLDVSGLAPVASDLIGLIEESPYFGNARFSSPVTRDSASGLEAFNLSIEISTAEER